MSLKLNPSFHTAPFFPPGIAHHKVVSTLFNDGKRPQTVKECKMLSKGKDSIMTSSLMNYKERCDNLRRFSNSTPNLKVCQISKQETSIHKQTCDMGLSNHSDFKATPLPTYYSSELMERSYSNYNRTNDKLKTRSLERLSSSTKARNLTGFIPDKPFYPPSKYPNMHDKCDTNIQRLIESRDKYKTPESRKNTHKIARRQSMGNIGRNNKEMETARNEKNNLRKSQNYGSVPFLQKDIKNKKSKKAPIVNENENVKSKEKVKENVESNIKPIFKSNMMNSANVNIKENENEKKTFKENSIKNPNTEGKTKTSPMKNDSNKNVSEDKFKNEKEIGPYRQSNKLDLEGSNKKSKNTSNEMFTSYFYPKPIPNQRMYNVNDRMAQSLILECSVASMIYTGSLDRANRNCQYQLPLEVTEVDDSPTKSISVPKRLNSFSQDSLDGNKGKKKHQMSINNVNNKLNQDRNNDEMSENSELDQSSTMSQIEEDELKTPCTPYSYMHSNSNHLLNNYWDSLPINNDVDQYNIDQLMKPSSSMKDLSSFSHSGRNSPISIHNEFISNREHSIIGKDDQTLLNDLASKCIVCTDRNHVQIIISNDNHRKPRDLLDPKANEYSIGVNDQKLLDNIASKSILSIDQKNDKISIVDENFTEISQLNTSVEFIAINEAFKTEQECDKNAAVINRSYNQYEKSYIAENFSDAAANDDIPRVTLGFNINHDVITRRTPEIHNFEDDITNTNLKRNNNYSNLHNPNDQGYCLAEKDLHSNWTRNIYDNTESELNGDGNLKGANSYHKETERPHSQYDSNKVFDQKFCEIIMTDENLTGIKYPHDHRYTQHNELSLLNGEGVYLPNNLDCKNDHTINEIEQNIEPIPISFVRPHSPYDFGHFKRNDNFENAKDNQTLEFDKNGEQIRMTYENLTGIKASDDLNNSSLSKNEHNHVSSNGETRTIVMGTDQFCNQIFVKGHNFATIQRVLSPIDGEYSIVKDILFNGQNLHLNSRTNHQYDPNIIVISPIGEYYNNEHSKDTINYQSRPSFLDSLNARHDEEKYNTNIVNRIKTIPSIEIERDRDVSDSASTNELSWSDYDDNRSCRDYVDNSVGIHRSGIPWVSSPELHSAQCYTGNTSRHLQSENPLKPLCSICHKPAYFMERISVSNIIFHKSCFRCRKCDTHLNFNNCIIYRNRPYCSVHMRSKVRRSVRSVSSKKLNLIKERLDNKSNLQKQSSTDVKQQKRIFYEGINSAKTKFLDDATKVKEIPIRDPKRITPPRQGVNSGVVESEPKPRDPNIVSCTDNQTSYLDEINLLTQNSSTKETRARFNELQNRSNGSKDIGDEDDSGLIRRPDVISVDTKSLRNRFTVGANDSNVKLNKINPTDEIRRLSEQETNSIYENEPEFRTDVIKSNSPKEDETVSPISRNRAKEMKEKFSNLAQNDTPKMSKLKLEYGEGGVYESNPQEKLEDVIKYNYDTTVYLPENTVKSGLQRIKDLQNEKSQGYQKSNKEPIKIDTDITQSGIYENTPEQSRADSISYQNNASLLEFGEKNYANEAKKILFEKQKQEEEVSSNRSPPHMIDIWKDLCPDSGIFENQPKEQRKDVVKHDDNKYELVVQNDNNSVSGDENVNYVEKSEEHDIQETY